jgi:hypothetical protein
MLCDYCMLGVKLEISVASMQHGVGLGLEIRLSVIRMYNTFNHPTPFRK